MVIKAQNFLGYLDISGPEVLGNDGPFDSWLGNTAQFRRSVIPGEILRVPDEYLRFPNIKNAVATGLLVVLAYDSNDDSLVINAELSGFSGGGGGGVQGTKFVFFDIHGGSDTAELKEINGTPCLVFSNNQEDNTAWVVSRPEDYVAGTTAAIEVFWSPNSSAAGDVVWQLNWKSTPAGSSVALSMTSVNLTQASPGSTSVLITTGTSLAIPAAGMVANNLLTVEIRRLGKDSADTYGGRAQVHLVRMRYTGVIATT
jgi:hypothetical protein